MKINDIIATIACLFFFWIFAKAAISNWKLQDGYRKYQDKETGWRYFFWPMVWVNKSYFEDKPELLEQKKKTERYFLYLALIIGTVSLSVWLKN